MCDNLIRKQYTAAAITAGVGILTAGYNIYKGVSQDAQAKKLASQNPYPNMPIPQGVLDATKMAENDAQAGLPGQQYLQAQQNIQRSQAQALQNANDRRGGIEAVGTINQNTNDANLGLDVANANARIKNRQALIAQKDNVGQWQGQQFGWNNQRKYLETAAAARALLGAGSQNINSGIDRGLGSVVKGLTGGRGGLFGSSYAGGTPTGIVTGTDPNVDNAGYQMQGDNYTNDNTIG